MELTLEKIMGYLEMNVMEERGRTKENGLLIQSEKDLMDEKEGGRIIQAIKSIRDKTGLGLREAKFLADRYRFRDKASKSSSRAGWTDEKSSEIVDEELDASSDDISVLCSDIERKDCEKDGECKDKFSDECFTSCRKVIITRTVSVDRDERKN